jgi:hypothetical protein
VPDLPKRRARAVGLDRAVGILVEMNLVKAAVGPPCPPSVPTARSPPKSACSKTDPTSSDELESWVLRAAPEARRRRLRG